MSHKQSDLNNSYMDGVRVKISEKYKPPPKITIAMTYAQRLTLNHQLQDNMPSYNFNLDTCVKEKMKEWRLARHTMSVDRKNKLEIIKQEEEQRQKTLELEKEQQLNNDSSRTEATNHDRLGSMLIPTQANILTPIPLAPQKLMQNTEDASPINISDFEPDTSSPFDNLELKTINDMEELKLVLQNDGKNKCQTQNNQTYAPSHNNYYNYMPTTSNHTVYSNNSVYTSFPTPETNGYAPYYSHTTSSIDKYSFANYSSGTNEYPNQFDSSSSVASSAVPKTINGTAYEPNAYNCVPNIIKTLHNQLNLDAEPTPSTLPEGNSEKSGNASHSEQCDNQRQLNEQEKLENPYSNLSAHSQAVCNSIANMGFPLERVARACKVLGDDEKKIVEYLLTMSQLMDLGFSEEKVASALVSSENDRDKALESLIS